MFLSSLLTFFYPPPPSASGIFTTAMSVLSVVSLTNAGWKETKGKHMKYSKFGNVENNNNDSRDKIQSKKGMILIYTPAFLAGLASFVLLPIGGDLRFDWLRVAVTTHFLKRVLEVLFVHQFSGTMDTEDAIAISFNYLLSSATMIYSQYLTIGVSEPDLDLKYVGIPIFLLGIGGNFYHHYLLSKLRSKGEKQYKIPQGGLFNLVLCPHYLFEIIGFMGISCISQTIYVLSFTLGSTLYLMGRSYATREWYKSKFEDFTKHGVKAMIPYIF